MITRLKILYIGAAVLALVALFIGSYAYFVAADEGRSLVADILIPFGAFVVIVVLYRRRKAGLESGSQLR